MSYPLVTITSRTHVMIPHYNILVIRAQYKGLPIYGDAAEIVASVPLVEGRDGLVSFAVVRMQTSGPFWLGLTQMNFPHGTKKGSTRFNSSFFCFYTLFCTNSM